MKIEQKNIIDLRNSLIPFSDSPSSYEQLLDEIDDAHIVLLGEASHGTHEFYTIRAEISKRLIADKGFNAIAIEGDWPDAYNVNRYIHQQKFTSAAEALSSFNRFPTWMWRNVPMVHFITWLAEYNADRVHEKQASFYGLDLYSLYQSIDAVITYLESKDPIAAQEARHYYSCLDHFRPDPQQYGYAVFTGMIRSCEDEVVEQLKRLHQETMDAHNGEAFYAQQNARVAKNAEYYYRSLFVDAVNNWNIRDSHMMETLNELMQFYKEQGIAQPKIIVWAHNSHIGNAQATQMGAMGEHNIGQLAKSHYGEKAYALGFTTYQGTVSAASQWHGHVERKNVRHALPGSYELLFHETGVAQFIVPSAALPCVPDVLLERAIGVIYLPQTERQSHYFYAHLAQQFDGVIHIDTTRAIEPLEKTSQWTEGEVPETYPTGL